VRPGDAPVRIDNRRPGTGRGGTSPYRGDHGYPSHHYNPWRGYGIGVGSHFYLGYYGPYWWYWPWWGSYYDYPYYYAYGPPRPYYYNNYYGDLGALDLDVSPEKAEIYLDGHYIGVADDFDGFPNYLWLEDGLYDVVFYKEGYGTLARRYKIVPGVVISVDDGLSPGESISPQEALLELVGEQGPLPQPIAREEERIADRRDEPAPEPRVIRKERRVEVRDRGTAGEPLDVRGEPGRLALRLTPEDASVYLDGRFLGTAGELARLHAGLIVDPGEHLLEVVRPGYESDRTEFKVEEGEEVTIELDLEQG